MYSESFSEEDTDEEGDEGAEERDANDDGDDAHNNDAHSPTPRAHPHNRGNQHYKEAGPSIQEHINNFVETDYLEDAGIWKPTATYPEDTVKLHELEFTRFPHSDCADGLLFDPTGMSPLDFFYKMWPRELFDHMSQAGGLWMFTACFLITTWSF